jgi:hypothetical protein
MTEAPRGLLHHLGQIFEIQQTEGCSYDEARERLEQQQREDEQEYSNVVNIAVYRKVH